MTNLMQIIWGGKKVNSITSVVLVNATAKTIDTVVPTAHRWLVLNIRITNPDDVVRAVNLIHYNEAAKTNILKNLAYSAALAASSADVLNFPNSNTAVTNKPMLGTVPLIVESGECLSCIWSSGGASTGGTDADGYVIEYLDAMR